MFYRKEALLLIYKAKKSPEKMEEMDSVGLDTTSLDDDAFNLEAAQDKCILRLIAACCNSEFICVCFSFHFV